MNNRKAVTIGDREITVREMTVGEVVAWFKALEPTETKPAGGAVSAADTVDNYLFWEITLSEIVRMTDLERADLDQLAPSEIQPIIDACKEVNPLFFAFRGRMIAVGERMLQGSAAASSASPAS